MSLKRKGIKTLFCIVTLAFLYGGLAVAGSGLTGVVSGVDVFGGSMAVKWNKTVVVFDLKNPELKGYRNVSDIRKGDIITVTYVKNGIRVTKGAQTGEDKNREIRKAGEDKKNAVKKSGKDARARVVLRSRGTSFEDVDENKDGAVSAAELSQIVPGLSMQQFRQYDTSGDGRLDRKEFYAIDPKAVRR
jgi:hypothetical protein